MYAAVLIAAAALSVQPTKTTPLDMLKICSFNDALADSAFMHHVVEVTSPVSAIERDGIGGYIVHLDASLHTTQMLGRIHVCCKCDPLTRDALARIRPGAVVTVRGVVREIHDKLDRIVDSHVVITMRNCEVVAGAE
jgi:hypothetical protein